MRHKYPVTAPPEPATAPLRAVGAGPQAEALDLDAVGLAGRRTSAATGLALLCLAAVLLEATTDLLPDDPVAWVLTPVRLILGAGLIALLVGGIGPARWRTPLDPAIALLLVAAAVATAVAGQEWSAWRGALTGVTAFYLTVGVRRGLPGSWPALGLLTLVAVATVSAVTVRQAADGITTGFCRGALDGTADVCDPGAMIRAVGTFANPNLLAAALVLLLPLAAAGSGALADRPSRLVGTALVVVGYAALLLTVSRGGILAAVAGLVAAVLLRHPPSGWRPGARNAGAHRQRHSRLRLLLLVGTAATTAGGLLVLAPAGSVGVRADVWTAATRLVVAHPFGVGPGQAGPLLDSAIPGDEAFQHAHNLWLNWAVEAGVAGLLAVLTITVGCAALAVRAAWFGSAPAAAAGAGLAGFAVMSVADHPANAIRVSLALWVVLALLAAERVGRRPSGQPGRGSATLARSRSGSR